ncbi:MAG: flavodoxin family protein [Candidatus Levybacteria bacterium]|nr:flavodoxin family protein [Candidatus Levybacteria bacterium]
MKILIVYATYSSGTHMAADVVSQELQKGGHTVDLKDVSETAIDNFNNYDLIILGSPSWDIGGQGGQPHEHFVAFMQQNKGKTFPGKKLAVFGLGDSTYPEFCGAVDHLEKFVDSLQGRRVIDSLRIDGYFFNQDEANGKIAEWVGKLQSY